MHAPHLGSDDVLKLIVSIVVVAITFFGSRYLSHRVRRGLQRGGITLNVSILLARFLWIGFWIAAILLVLSVNGIALTPLAAFIGVVGLAASLSLQQVLQNLVAGIYLLAERPFNIGDTVSVIGPTGLNHEGRVEDIQMRTTHLRSRDDELILVPNASMFAGVVTNRTAVGGYAGEVTVTFPRDTNPKAMKEKVANLLDEIPCVLTRPSPQLHINQADKENWTGRVHFWTGSWDGKSDVISSLADAFPEAIVNDGKPA
jgi:small conductance mechanosensitive channel